jgi:hypothetical protein
MSVRISVRLRAGQAVQGEQLAVVTVDRESDRKALQNCYSEIDAWRVLVICGRGRAGAL